MRSWRRANFSSSCAFGMAKSGNVLRIGPRSMPTTFRPCSASSFAMMVPVSPTPTITTSTLFSLVAAMSLSSVFLRQEDVLRVAVLVGRDLLLMHVGDRNRLGVVGHVVLVDVVRVRRRHAGKAHQLPADLVPDAAVDRVGEEALEGVGQHEIEEKAAGHRLYRQLSRFELRQGLIFFFIPQ